jgi:hypothetical protein
MWCAVVSLRGLPVTAAPLRAPREDGGVLAVPDLSEAGALAASNRQRLAHGPPLLGRPWTELQREARQLARQAAEDYLRRAGEPLPSFAAAAIFLAGHQPELFHPGVWIKNFALCGLARRQGATPINLIVDNDTVKSVSLLVPPVSVPLPPARSCPRQRLALPFDRSQEETPYEERRVVDEELFASLPARLPGLWGYEPFLPRFWSEVLRQAPRTPLLGERLAAARRAWERRWGCHNLELPVSLLCATPAFAWFASHLLLHLPRFQQLYNQVVQAYRRRHGIRSPRHPVPDLAQVADWYEAPFWAWQAGSLRRGRLFVRLTPQAVELRQDQTPWPALPRPGCASENFVRAFAELERRGFKVRSRALTTTLFARLFVGDLFLHGLGGGRYDELTDELIRQFYGLEPPHFVILSATLLLPLPRYPATVADYQRLSRLARDLRWNPQRHLEEVPGVDGQARQLCQEKLAWIARQPHSRDERRQRFQRLRQLTAALQPFLASRQRQVEDALQNCAAELALNDLLSRRDYAFCLYPEERLRTFCTQFLS